MLLGHVFLAAAASAAAAKLTVTLSTCWCAANTSIGTESSQHAAARTLTTHLCG